MCGISGIISKKNKSQNNQKFKQGLSQNDRNFNKQKDHNFILSLINDSSFNKRLNKNLLLKDFQTQPQSHEVVWHLIKHYLMLDELKNIYYNVEKNYDKTFYSTNNLKEKT